MDDVRKEMYDTLMKQYEEEFFHQNGFTMNRQQRRLAEKRVKEMLERKIKSIKKLSI